MVGVKRLLVNFGDACATGRAQLGSGLSIVFLQAFVLQDLVSNAFVLGGRPHWSYHILQTPSLPKDACSKFGIQSMRSSKINRNISLWTVVSLRLQHVLFATSGSLGRGIYNLEFSAVAGPPSPHGMSVRGPTVRKLV